MIPHAMWWPSLHPAELKAPRAAGYASYSSTEPQASLPAGDTEDSAHCIADPVRDVRALPVSHCAHCLLNA